MKTIKSAAIVIVAFACTTIPVLALPPGGEQTAAALINVEHGWLAALNRHDATTLARILGREFIDSDFQGDAITRAQYLAYFSHPVSGPAPRIRQTFEDTRVRFVGDGEVAIVTGIVVTRVAAAPGAAAAARQDRVTHSRFTDVFVWRDARWQAVSGQETHFTPAR